MNIFFTVDDKFKNYLFSTLYTILSTSDQNDSFNFFVLDAGLSDETKKNVELFKSIKNFEISYTPMTDREFKDYPINPCLSSKVYYYRLKIPTMFPQVKRALFLDTDIFVRGSLAPLYNLDMQGHTVACVVNGNLENELQNNRLGLSEKHQYFNAGVLLIDCEKWRNENILDKVEQVAKEKVDVLKWADQDILNLVFEKNYQVLPLKYNFWPGINSPEYEPSFENYKKWYLHSLYKDEDLHEAMEHPVIIHFAGGAKPDREFAVTTVRELSAKINDELLARGLISDNGMDFSWKLCELEEYVEATEKCEATHEVLQLVEKFRFVYGKEPKILEAGSGNGRVIFYLERKGCKDVSGIEINKTVVAQIHKEYPQIKIYHGNILEIPEQFKHNDIVLSYGVIEHFVSGLEKPFKEIFDSVAPGGYAVVSLPCFNYCRRFQSFFDKKNKKLMKKHNYLYYVRFLNDAFYEYHLTPKQFKEECLKAGFEILMHKPMQHELGIMHLLNLSNKKHKHIWYDKQENYHYSFLGKIFRKLCDIIPFLACHEQFCVLKRKKQD